MQREIITQSVWLPFPPTLNNLFAHGIINIGNGKQTVKRYPSRRYKAWQKEAYPLLRLARLRYVYGPDIGVTIDITPPDSRRRDRDNYRKAILDALVKCQIIQDDCYVDQAPVTWATSGAIGAVISITGAVDASHTPRPIRRQNTTSDADALKRIREHGPIKLTDAGMPVLKGQMLALLPAVLRLRRSGHLIEAGDGLFGTSQTLIVNEKAPAQ
ncbi:MAG: RusA family crossover junction endodeoxyribonuclease [Pseudomonadota bacterium]